MCLKLGRNPGGRQDDEVLYGFGRNNDSFHDGSTTGPLTSAPTHPTTSSNDPTTSTSLYPLGSSSTTTTNPSSTHPHGYGKESGVTGTGHDSALNPHPFADHGLGVVEKSSTSGTTTTNPSSTHSHGYGKESGVTSTGHDSAVNPHPFAGHGLGVVESSSTSGASGTFDDGATTASIKSGVAGKSQGGSLINPTEKHSPLSSNKPISEPTAHSGSTTHTAGPHSSDLANRADPRVDSDRDGHKGLGTSTAGTGSGLTSSGLPDRSAQGLVFEIPTLLLSYKILIQSPTGLVTEVNNLIRRIRHILVAMPLLGLEHLGLEPLPTITTIRSWTGLLTTLRTRHILGVIPPLGVVEPSELAPLPTKHPTVSETGLIIIPQTRHTLVVMLP